MFVFAHKSGNVIKNKLIDKFYGKPIKLYKISAILWICSMNESHYK